jgi:hypothetical protein
LAFSIIFDEVLRMFGRSSGTVHLKQGDFLEDEKVHRIIEKADVVFVNKYLKYFFPYSN